MCTMIYNINYYIYYTKYRLNSFAFKIRENIIFNLYYIISNLYYLYNISSNIVYFSSSLFSMSNTCSN